MGGGRSRIGVDVDLGIVLHFFHISININTHSQCHRTTLDWEQFDYISFENCVKMSKFRNFSFAVLYLFSARAAKLKITIKH